MSGYAIVQCQECTLLFVQNPPTAERLGQHYQQTDPSYEDDNRECLLFYCLRLRSKIENLIADPGTLLDVGCSRGYFFEAMRDWQCYGIELNQNDARLAEQRAGPGRVFGGALENYQPSVTFDLITMQDVFDHLPDPVGALRKCRDILRPGGLMVIKVHDISCLYARMSGAGWYAVIPPSHLFYYNRRSLRRILANGGYDYLGHAYIPHLLKVSTILLRLSRGNCGSVFYRAHRRFSRSRLGDIRIRKNLHDIITVFARKPL